MPPRNFLKKIAALRLNLVGFWQLADYPTLVFKITAFYTYKCILEQDFKVIMALINIVTKIFGGGGEKLAFGGISHLYETLLMILSSRPRRQDVGELYPIPRIVQEIKDQKELYGVIHIHETYYQVGV